MVQLDDLSDDCLMEVLEWLFPYELFKLQRLNKRVNRLASVKIQVKIKMISFGYLNCSDCYFHIGSINSYYQNLKLTTCRYDFFQLPSRTASFLRLFSMCPNVKSVDFGFEELPIDLILEVIRRLPEIECIKIDWFVKKEFLDRVLDLIGNKIVHISMDSISDASEVAMLANVFALKCPNIKQFDCFFPCLTSDFLSQFKWMPKNCRLKISCYNIIYEVFEDVVDELNICKLNWSQFGHRLDRLSSLKIKEHLDFGDGPLRGVNFAALKKLDLSNNNKYYFSSLNCLTASRFPQLEEFHLNITSHSCFDDFDFIITDFLLITDFDALFQRMASIKKLVLYWKFSFLLEVVPQIHRSVVNKLKNLETIEFQIKHHKSEWKPEIFLQPLEMYVDEIISLKKLTVKIWNGGVVNEPIRKMLSDQVKRMMKKQNRVKVSLIYTNVIGFTSKF